MQDSKNTIYRPEISIIIPCYNDSLYVEQSVNSALNQTYPNKEVILVDDGSNAETKLILNKLAPKISKLITQENQGQSAARNKAIAAASGDYILNLDSDDYFDPTFCEKAIAKFQEDEAIGLVTCYVRRFNDDGTVDIYYPDGGLLTNFLLTNCAMGSSMFKKNDWQKLNGYDEMMKNGFEDWEFYIRLLKSGSSAHVIPEVLFNYRLKSNSTTSKANLIKHDLLEYIYIKHRDLYIANFDSFVKHLLCKNKREEQEKIKNTERIDFIIGKSILRPLRWLKAKLK